MKLRLLTPLLLLTLPMLRRVVWGGGSVVLAVVNGGKAESRSIVVKGAGSVVGMKAFVVGLGVVFLLKIGFLGLNLL